MRVLLAILFAAGGPAMQHTAADTTTAQGSLVRPADLGTGWTSKPPTAQTGVQLSCSGHAVSGAGVVETGAAASPVFTYGKVGSSIVSQNTSVYATAAQASTYWSRAVTKSLITCVTQSLTVLRSRGITVKVTFQGTLPLPLPVKHAAAYRAVAKVGKNNLTYAIDVIVLSTRNAITSLTFINIQQLPAVKAEVALADKVASRLGGPSTA